MNVDICGDEGWYLIFFDTFTKTVLHRGKQHTEYQKFFTIILEEQHFHWDVKLIREVGETATQ